MARFSEAVKSVRTLRRLGVRRSSILLFPIRRRLLDGTRLKFEDGTTLTAPKEERLVTLLNDIWGDECYDKDVQSGSGDTVMDIGAHVGVFSVRAARKWPASRIVAIEPSEGSFSYLSRNVSENRLTNVTAIRAACAGSSGTSLLHAKAGHAQATSLYDTGQGGGRSQQVTETVSLGELFTRQQVDRCSLLKMDCEGAEYEILFHAGAETLERVKRIAMEYHVGPRNQGVGDLVDVLTRNNFSIDRVQPFRDGRGFLTARR